MRIGEAAAAAGCTPRALRLYEERGLLPPPGRTASGQRDYRPAEVALLRVIRELLGSGFTIEDLRSCADRLHLLTEDPPPRCGAADAPEGSGSGVVGRRLAALDAEIARLVRLREDLARRVFGDDARRSAPEPAAEQTAEQTAEPTAGQIPEPAAPPPPATSPVRAPVTGPTVTVGPRVLLD
ncbi:MerR family transcriptional regulator [Streptomyces sp. ID03-2B]|uniref:MerR family transcriptional regulator n=1 Tax=Streptomyces sp. ID03-2B TaxID=3028660 RepID=UPI0039F717FB